MGPIKAVETVVFKTFTFSGRASRSEYWWWTLAQSLAMTAAVAADMAKLMALSEGAPTAADVSFWGFWSPILGLLVMIPSLSVSIRRLHDSGRSGFAYLMMFVPLVGGIIFLIYMCLPSQSEDNIYGPPPNRPDHWGGGGLASGGGATGLPSIGGAASKAKHNPYAGYALLAQQGDDYSEEQKAERRQSVQDYYRSRVLSGVQTQEAG